MVSLAEEVEELHRLGQLSELEEQVWKAVSSACRFCLVCWRTLRMSNVNRYVYNRDDMSGEKRVRDIRL